MKKKEKEEEIAFYFLVGRQIFEFEERGERVWFSKLVETFRDLISPKEVSYSINLLRDWGHLRIEYGETAPGHGGMLFFLTCEGREKYTEMITLNKED